MNKNIVVAIGLTCLLSSCVTSYQDPRTPEEKAKQTNNAINSLYGDYIVKDSRNNDDKVTSVTISPVSSSISANFTTSNGTFKLYGGAECYGGYRESDMYANLFCINERPGEHISTILLKRIISPETISDGAMVFGFKNMKIESGYYLEYTLGNNGRRHVFSLEKK